VTSNTDQASRQYRSPASIRNEDFPRRMRGLDANEVYEYLDQLADQVQAMDTERHGIRTDNERLQAENARLQGELQRMRSELTELEGAGDRVNGQVVELLSQAQLVAEEMVDDVSRDARERMNQAREQERQILAEAIETAEQTRRDAEALIRWASPGGANGSSSSPVNGSNGYEPGRHSAADVAAATAELEQVRSFARAAQAQMQSIMASFAAGVGQLGAAPPADEPDAPAQLQNGASPPDMSVWQVESPRASRDWGSD
jgi:DivIVA domain-containing protein